MRKRRILIVDDDATLVVFLRDILEFKGYEVEVAHDGLEGLEKASRGKPDLILLDVMMPKMDGYQVCRVLKDNPATASIPLLMLTAKGQVSERVKGLNIGADDYLPKPCDKEELEARVEALLRRFPERLPILDSRATCTFSMLFDKHQPIQFTLSGADTFAAHSKNPLDIDDYGIDAYARKARDAYGADDWRFHVKDIGRGLSAKFFAEHLEAATCYNRAIGKVIKERDLRLIFKSSAQFLRVPLEFLYDDPDYFILRHPVNRFVVGMHTTKLPISAQSLNAVADKKERLKILLIASNTDVINGVDQEIAALDSLLRTIMRDSDFVCEITCIPTEDATYTRVHKELRQCKYHILHYAGHGYYDEKSAEESCLSFWENKNRQGKILSMRASEMATLLRDSELRFAYLSCCLGTTTGESAQLLDDDFLGVADGIVRAGVPSVLGFRWVVSDDGAKRLALAFYESLFSQGDLATALLDARCRVSEKSRDEKAWISPILIIQQ